MSATHHPTKDKMKTYKVTVDQDKTIHWYLNNQLHREDGPAVEYASGDKWWFINGKELTEQKFNARTKPSWEGRVVEIDGKKYKLQQVK